MNKKKGSPYSPVSRSEITEGLAYAENEYPGVDVHPVLLAVLTNTVCKLMRNKADRKLDDVRAEVLQRAYRTEFRRAVDTDGLRKEIEVLSAAMGKLFNNRQNREKPGFSATTRVSPKKERRPRVVVSENGQMRMHL